MGSSNNPNSPSFAATPTPAATFGGGDLYYAFAGLGEASSSDPDPNMSSDSESLKKESSEAMSSAIGAGWAGDGSSPKRSKSPSSASASPTSSLRITNFSCYTCPPSFLGFFSTRLGLLTTGLTFFSGAFLIFAAYSEGFCTCCFFSSSFFLCLEKLKPAFLC